MTRLWDHQAGAVKAAVSHLAAGGRCQVIMACGTGKTIVGAEVSRETAPDGAVLVVVPTLELLAQTARAYAAQLGAGAGLIGAVCSESSATIEAAELRAEMEHLHAGVTTDPAGLARWLRRPGRKTVLVTYASLPVIVAAHTIGARPTWDLVVIDEAHRSAGRTDRAWHVIHDDARIPARRRLYMTATPRILVSEQHEVTSMDDPAVFGPEVYRLPFADAIGRGLLADYRVLISVVTDTDVAALAGSDVALSAHGPAVPADMLAAQVTLLKACREWDLRRVITYHHRVNRAHRFAGTLLNAADLLGDDEKPGQVRGWAVDGSMRLDQRREALRHLRQPMGQCVVVSNARVLAEGVDVPELDGVMFGDPRDSATDVVQAVGRALRLGASARKIATIIIPVILPAGETPEAALDTSAYAAVWRVVRALRAHDERVADWLDDHRAALHAERAGDGGHQELPDWLTVRGIPVTARFARSLRVRLVGTATSAWMTYLDAARAFRAEHGHLNVPQRAVRATIPLGRWIADQRSRRNRGELTAAQVTALTDLGMIWDFHAASRAELEAEAAAWAGEHGHLDVPRDHITPSGYPLGARIGSARLRRARGNLHPGTEAMLERLGIRWNTVTAGRDAEISRARAYHAEHHTINIPDDTVTADGYRIGRWVSRQRYRHRIGTLHPDRQAALEEMGIDWEPSPDGWEPWLDRARSYHATHGDLNVPAGYRTADGWRLGTWLVMRRVDHRKGDLLPERAAALEELGIVWDVLEARWEDGLRRAAEHARENGTPMVARDYVTPDGFRLGQWIANNRARQRQGRLRADRKSRLDAIGVVW